jgi:type VI secretion system secreted protein Hcp
MAVDMFNKIGDLKGEAQDQKHKGEIDVITWTWGVSNSGTAHAGSGAGAGKANVQDLSFTKWMDKSRHHFSVLQRKTFQQAFNCT